MIAAVALLSFAYLLTIELMAFSYAISGCSFSMSATHSERKPFHRLPRREKTPMTFILSGGWFLQTWRIADNFGYGVLTKELEHFLYIELLHVAAADHGLLLFDSLLHDRA